MDVYTLWEILNKSYDEVDLWPVVVDLKDGETPRRIESVEWDKDAKVFVLEVE